jgi:excisionase family DNA binding protein
MTNNLTNHSTDKKTSISKKSPKTVIAANFLQVNAQKIPLSLQEGQNLLAYLTILRQGTNSITVQEKYLTTQAAADILNVSRPYLIKLLENGEIPFIKVGNRRKILTNDLLEYCRSRDHQRRETLQTFSEGLAADGLYDLDYDSVQEILNSDLSD